MMKPGSFIIDNVDSESIGTVIQSRPLLQTPRRRVEFKTAFGQSGSIPYDEQAYDNTELVLICFTNMEILASGFTAALNRETIFNLFNGPTYKNLIMYADPEKIYKVMLAEPISFESRYFMGEGVTYELKLSVKPYKMLFESPKKVITGSSTIYNPTAYTSLPEIKVNGRGDVTLFVNGVPFVLKGLSDSVIINSEIMSTYFENGSTILSRNNKVYTRNYPFFKSGSNTISWTGSVTSLEILPKWRALI